MRKTNYFNKKTMPGNREMKYFFGITILRIKVFFLIRYVKNFEKSKR